MGHGPEMFVLGYTALNNTYLIASCWLERNFRDCHTTHVRKCSDSKETTRI